MDNDRTIVSRIRATIERGSRTAGRGGYVLAWSWRLGSRRSCLAALLAALALAAGANAAGASPPAAARLAAATDAFAAAHPTYPGVALAVVSPRLHWTGSAGHPAFGAHATLDPRAGFRIASVTKTFTAGSILRLVEGGRLGLDDPIAAHLAPAMVALLRSGGYDPQAIHVRHLLMHTSGLYDYASDPKFVEYVLTH